jgi:AraC-like DNA-binding protein
MSGRAGSMSVPPASRRAIVGAMDPIHPPRALDPVSALLQAVRVRSSVFCRSLWGAPWGCGIEPRGSPAFHAVTSGACWLEVEGATTQIRLEPGDLALVAGGQRHWVRDEPGTPAPDLELAVAGAPGNGLGGAVLGGDGPTTGLVCGGFTLEGTRAPDLLRALPPVVHVRGSAGRPVPWVGAALALVEEIDPGTPGRDAVVSRLADTLLVHALAVWLDGLDPDERARLLALGDPDVARAVDAVHLRPEHAWTVGELAAEAALSRSAFGTRFRDLLGEPPGRYCNRCRLAHAARLLERTDDALAEIAARSGYRSEYSFGKAFKREFGVSPGRYRAARSEPPHIALQA